MSEQRSLFMPPEAVPSQSGTTKTCLECQGAYQPYKRARGFQVFCSETCRLRYWKALDLAAKLAAKIPFEPHKLVRPTDPETSVAAAEGARALQAKHHRIILDALLEGPKTSEEISQATPLSHPQAWRRMGELQARGYVKDTGERRPNTSGSKAIVWALADER